eukprot:CAMPEP_0118715920 /NCGR_PEP_ID=MMETSP0800-20121206/27195_1 /TAXON_ID=210618 ORGANISM="Striatella unipunctata, Strain CCMP2910" /NCGR_SAMPLE_ID=MMETSP0800 /ASSEMBLY_ACC=CAM_ASM_000638 /LENGTH=354 /DNA_ID=CAMNT_0006622247 /DNA_START=92 /DNA_END=1156 /DNA_ORIENTATION=+
MTMTKSLFVLLSACALVVDAFQAPSFTTHTAFTTTTSTRSKETALFASRAARKAKTRKAWMIKRGFLAPDGGPAPTIEKGEEGLEYVKLVHPDTGATSDIYLYGGVVTSYVVDGHEYIAVRPDAKMDGSKPISGGLSHCWPQFGPGEIQQHGFARNVMWTVKEQTATNVVLEMLPSDYTKEMWDKEFKCTFTVTLEADKLNTKMVVDNVGEEDSFDFQAALHSYFTVSSLDKLEITGSFEGKEFLNKMVGDEGEMQTEDRSAITISEEYDRVYKGVNDPVLKDAGAEKTLEILNTAGYEDTVLWNPYGNEGMGFNNFVCVESVKFDPVTLEAGGQWVGEMALKASSMGGEEDEP